MAQGPGIQLRAERESLGVSLREVAETLNLSVTVVEALEADDFERLPGDVFARGYIRAYARLLELDPQPLLDRYPARSTGREARPRSDDDGIAEWIRRRPALVLSSAGLLVLGLLIMLVVAIWPEDGIESLLGSSDVPDVAIPPATDERWSWQEDGATSTEAEDGQSKAEINAGMNGQGDDRVDAAPAGVAADPASVAAEAGASGDDAGALSVDLRGEVVEGVLLAAGDDAASGDGIMRRITEAGDERLDLACSADSWVEVRDPAGKVLYSKLCTADTELALVGQGPFRIVLGYAPGVSLKFAGEAVVLTPHTRNSVATLVLGQ